LGIGENAVFLGIERILMNYYRPWIFFFFFFFFFRASFIKRGIPMALFENCGVSSCCESRVEGVVEFCGWIGGFLVEPMDVDGLSGDGAD
jgi:hypothetical protein